MKTKNTANGVMSVNEARSTMDAFVSGYIELNNLSLIEAGRVLGKRAVVSSTPSISNPEVLISIRRIA